MISEYVFEWMDKFEALLMNLFKNQAMYIIQHMPTLVSSEAAVSPVSQRPCCSLSFLSKHADGGQTAKEADSRMPDLLKTRIFVNLLSW